jgi:hypothetical protein
MPSGTWGSTHNIETWWWSVTYGLQHNQKFYLHHKIVKSSSAQSCTQHSKNIRGRSTTNYHGDDVDLDMDMVLMVVVGEDGVVNTPPTPTRSWWRRRQRFPLGGGRGTTIAGMSEVEEGFCLRCSLRKFLKKIWSMVFSRVGEVRKKGEVKVTLGGRDGPGGAVPTSDSAT